MQANRISASYQTDLLPYGVVTAEKLYASAVAETALLELHPNWVWQSLALALLLHSLYIDTRQMYPDSSSLL